jgi:hypothetical protein
VGCVGYTCPRVARAGGDCCSRFHSLRHEGALRACILQMLEQGSGWINLPTLRERFCIPTTTQVLEADWLHYSRAGMRLSGRWSCGWTLRASTRGGSGWDSCCRRRLSGTPVIQQGKWLDTSHRSPCAGSQRLRLANYDRQHGVDSHLETTAYVDVVQPPVAFKPSVRPLDAHPAVIDGLPLRCLRNLSHSLFMSWIRVDDRLG